MAVIEAYCYFYPGFLSKGNKMDCPRSVWVKSAQSLWNCSFHLTFKMNIGAGVCMVIFCSPPRLWKGTFDFIQGSEKELLTLFKALRRNLWLYSRLWEGTFDFIQGSEKEPLTLSKALRRNVWLYPRLREGILDFIQGSEKELLTLPKAPRRNLWLYSRLWEGTFDFIQGSEKEPLTLYKAPRRNLWLYPRLREGTFDFIQGSEKEPLTLSKAPRRNLWLYPRLWEGTFDFIQQHRLGVVNLWLSVIMYDIKRPCSESFCFPVWWGGGGGGEELGPCVGGGRGVSLWARAFLFRCITLYYSSFDFILILSFVFKFLEVCCSFGVTCWHIICYYLDNRKISLISTMWKDLK